MKVAINVFGAIWAFCLLSSKLTLFVSADDWFDLFPDDEIIEHPCPTGVGEYPHPWYPDRFYDCISTFGRLHYEREYVCPPGTCYNGSSPFKCSLGCGSISTKIDEDHPCDPLGYAPGQGSYINQKDPSRFYKCEKNRFGQLVYNYEQRCPYSQCATGGSHWPCGSGFLWCLPFILEKEKNKNYTLLYENKKNRIGIQQMVKNNADAKVDEEAPPLPKIPDDYIVWDDQIVHMHIFNDSGRNAISNPYQRWYNGIVPYYIHPALRNIERLILHAMNEFHSNTCIRFIPWTPGMRDYVYIHAGIGCSSAVGRVPGGQELSLGRGCEGVGTILHELLHAIGFYHEHNRSDRDDYLNIHWENIQPEAYSQFIKLPRQDNILFDAFNPASIMIYGNYAFSKNNRPTMTLKSGQRLPDIHFWNRLPAADAARVNALYHCRR